MLFPFVKPERWSLLESESDDATGFRELSSPRTFKWTAATWLAEARRAATRIERGVKVMKGGKGRVRGCGRRQGLICASAHILFVTVCHHPDPAQCLALPFQHVRLTFTYMHYKQ